MGRFNVASLLGARPKELRAEEASKITTKKILFVCTGNIARSASAQYLAQSMAGEHTDWIFESAGVGAVVGSGVAKHIDTELSSRGISFEGHRARQITLPMIEEATLVLVMDKEHLNWIVREWPQYRYKVHLLRQMARSRDEAERRTEPISFMYQQDQGPRSGDNIADPYRRGPERAKKAVAEVEEALQVIVPWLGS